MQKRDLLVSEAGGRLAICRSIGYRIVVMKISTCLIALEIGDSKIAAKPSVFLM